VVIGYLGSLSFVIVYFGSLVCGSLLTIFHKDDYNYRAVGASGAVTGVLYSAILLQPDMMLSFIIPMPAYLLESSIYCILFTE
jgi:membrane associated rhomboid family serine protease